MTLEKHLAVLVSDLKVAKRYLGRVETGLRKVQAQVRLARVAPEKRSPGRRPADSFTGNAATGGSDGRPGLVGHSDRA
jgi:hypothetical protein